MDNRFSAEKALWHIDKIAQLRQGKDIIPTHVQIILSDLCNQNCHFCAYRMDGGFSTEGFADADGNKNPVRFIPTEKAKEILTDCARLGAQAIEFTGGGEPTVHKDCYEIIDFAQSLGLETGLVTNGVRLKPHSCIENLTWLRISVDAGTPETYEMVRESKAWPTVMKNLKYAGSLTKPYVGLGYVITRENYLEIYDGCHIAREAGIPYVRLSAMFSEYGADYYEGIDHEVRRQIEKAKALERDNFKVVNFFENRVHDLEMGKPDYQFCGEQQFVLYIGGDQKVYTCCTNAYTKHGEIGDLKSQSFASWLKSTRRYDFDARSCHHCQFNDKNKIINWALSKPAHVNFV
jgi:MoaA/NifB/PqqE/SkfB family radical SAM enzyme